MNPDGTMSIREYIQELREESAEAAWKQIIQEEEADVKKAMARAVPGYHQGRKRFASFVGQLLLLWVGIVVVLPIFGWYTVPLLIGLWLLSYGHAK